MSFQGMKLILQLEAWTISKQLQKELEANWLLWTMLQISHTTKISNETMLPEAETTRSHINRIDFYIPEDERI